MGRLGERGLGCRRCTKTHLAGELPVSAERRRCLYDHVLCLQELLGAATGGEVTVELADAALELVDVA